MFSIIEAAYDNSEMKINDAKMYDRQKKREEKERKRMEERQRSDEKWSMVRRTLDGKAPRLDD